MILFRVEGNTIIGSGHVMRCLSIADAFCAENRECCFAVAEDAFVKFIEQRGYKAFVLGTDYREMEEELPILEKCITELKVDRMIVDSYYVTEKYLSTLNSIIPVTYIDDLAAFAYPVDTVVNYNVYGTELDYRGLYKDADVTLPDLFLGMKYIPFRNEFRYVERKKIAEPCRDILISTGGADPVHLAKKLVQYISNRGNTTYRYHVVLGAMNQDKAEIEAIAADMDSLVLYTNVTDMKGLMSSCDIAVSAAGSTLYELCVCGVPTITYVLADNQIFGATAFDNMGLMQFVGDVREAFSVEEKILDAIRLLAKDYEKRKSMSERMQHMVDGYGAERLVKALLKIN